MFLASGPSEWPAGSESMTKSSTGEPQRFAGIINKVRGLPSLALAEVCLGNKDKAPKEQLWSLGDLRKAETIHQLFFFFLSISNSVPDTMIKISHNHIEPLRQLCKIVTPRFHGESVVVSIPLRHVTLRPIS